MTADQRGSGADTGPRLRAVPGELALDRRHLPARVSDERFPARGRVAVFEAPRDASSLADRWLDSCQRRCEPSPEAVCIGKSDTSRDTPRKGWSGCLQYAHGGNPLQREPLAIDMPLQDAGRPSGRPALVYLSGSLTALEFDPPSESFAFTLRLNVPAPADVFGVSFAVHVVELAFVIVTVR